MANDAPARIATAPVSSEWIDAAVVDGGGVVVLPAEATGIVWTQSDAPDQLAEILEANPQIDWVQLPWAGIEPYVPLLSDAQTWTCAKGVYADPVAEHALAMLLAGFRHLPAYVREQTWTRDAGRNLFDANVTILGGGGIAQVLIGLLQPFRPTITVVRRNVVEMPGVQRVLGADALHQALADADAVVLALPLLDDTDGVLGSAEFAAMGRAPWIINVARGKHIQTDALVAALRSGQVGGAGLDVTDPEPLPDGHPLWSMSNVIITPHTGNTKAMARPLLSSRIRDNVRRYVAGEPLVGVVDVELGY